MENNFLVETFKKAFKVALKDAVYPMLIGKNETEIAREQTEIIRLVKSSLTELNTSVKTLAPGIDIDTVYPYLIATGTKVLKDHIEGRLGALADHLGISQGLVDPKILNRSDTVISALDNSINQLRIHANQLNLEVLRLSDIVIVSGEPKISEEAAKRVEKHFTYYVNNDEDLLTLKVLAKYAAVHNELTTFLAQHGYEGHMTSVYNGGHLSNFFTEQSDLTLKVNPSAPSWFSAFARRAGLPVVVKG